MNKHVRQEPQYFPHSTSDVTPFPRLLGDASGGCVPNVSSQLRRLVTREDVKYLLQLREEKLQMLVDTRQITAIRIAGEERFDTQEVFQLIEIYKSTASRRVL